MASPPFRERPIRTRWGTDSYRVGKSKIVVQFLSVSRKNDHMKKFIFSGVFLLIISSVYPQAAKTDVLQDLEKNQPNNAAGQKTVTTATIKSATRLFKDKNDLTSVIMVIPQDSVVYVLGSDTTFLNVVFEGNEGYIYARHAEINTPVRVTKPALIQTQVSRGATEGQEGRPVQTQTISRYEYLENKYDPSMAARLYEGKVWKGMSAQMAKDSWGSPKKINRVISGNVVKEEWFFSTTWLYFQNSTLTGWGPVKD
jgi:hypothetical protein